MDTQERNVWFFCMYDIPLMLLAESKVWFVVGVFSFLWIIGHLRFAPHMHVMCGRVISVVILPQLGLH